MIAAGRERAVDVAEVGGERLPGDRAARGSTPTSTRSRSSTRLKLGSFVYAYGTVRALLAWRPAHWQVVIDGESRAFDGYSVAVANSGVFGGGMYLVPDASSTTACSTSCSMDAMPKRRYLANLPKVFKGTHVHDAGPAHPARRARSPSTPTGRSRLYADGDPIAELPATVRVAPGALRVLAPEAPR